MDSNSGGDARKRRQERLEQIAEELRGISERWEEIGNGNGNGNSSGENRNPTPNANPGEKEEPSASGLLQAQQQKLLQEQAHLLRLQQK
ncbi:unnamed protein product [Darwinula stevensoni]|uniref:Uncharacterized protein n=1 Tax=Darwinula stevensoni TaxID=69355 RepID=A0A7R9AIY1_9CRUS|nr:unnamed protein product [Darwinula stevensoni]CAG0907229.1 unnamed protein product [Darwinula stevensoni]